MCAACTHKSRTAAWQFSICEFLPQRASLQATSSNVRELSCLEVEEKSPKLRGIASRLQDGVEEHNANILSKEEARATKAQKKHARMQLRAK